MKTGVHLYRFWTFSFDHGLLLKDFDYHSISSHNVLMPSFLLALFHASEHLAVTEATFPLPHEWELQEDEQVIIVRSEEHTSELQTP